MKLFKIIFTGIFLLGIFSFEYISAQGEFSKWQQNQIAIMENFFQNKSPVIQAKGSRLIERKKDSFTKKNNQIISSTVKRFKYLDAVISSGCDSLNCARQIGMQSHQASDVKKKNCENLSDSNEAVYNQLVADGLCP